MILRRLYNGFRLQRGMLTILAIVGLVFVIGFVGLILVDIYVHADLWRGEDRSEFLTALTFIPCLVGLIALVIGLNRQSIAFEIKRTRGIYRACDRHYDIAEKYMRQALSIADGFALDDPRRGDVLVRLARYTQAQGNYDDAETFGQQAILAQQWAWGSDHPRTLEAIEWLARIYARIARYAQEKPLLERALAMREARIFDNPALLTRSLCALGEFYLAIDRPDEAETPLRRALHIANERLDRLSPQRLPILTMLAEVCVRKNQIDEADAFAQEAHALGQKIGRRRFLSQATCLYYVGLVRHHQERHEEAEQFVRQAIALLAKTCDADVMIWDDELHLLGKILRAQSRWSEAEECFQKVLRFRQEYLAPEDLATARVLEDYAELLELMGRNEEAHAHEHHARQIREYHAALLVG